MKHPRRTVAIPEPALTAAQLARLADGAIAGDVVQPGSLTDCCALLAVLYERGYELKRRTEWEQRAAPWLFLVVPRVSAETEGA